MLPVLFPPTGVLFRLTVEGGGSNRWTSEVVAETDLSPEALERHFTQQMQAAGWRPPRQTFMQTYAASTGEECPQVYGRK